MLVNECVLILPTVFLILPGTLNADAIRNTLTQHVVDRRDQNGELMFPRLRHVLVSCWGNYAWDASAPFRPESHLIVASGIYRGRPVNDSNIQVRIVIFLTISFL